MDVIYLLPDRSKEVSKELMVLLAMPAPILFVILVGQLHSQVAKDFQDEIVSGARLFRL